MITSYNRADFETQEGVFTLVISVEENLCFLGGYPSESINTNFLIRIIGLQKIIRPQNQIIRVLTASIQWETRSIKSRKLEMEI
jgi:hypothetical protein